MDKQKNASMDKQKSTGVKENCYFGLQVRVPNLNSLYIPPMFVLVHEAQFLRLKKKIYLHTFTDKKSLDVIILPIIWVLKFFLFSCFRRVFLLTALTSLLPGVMLLSSSTISRDSATDIVKTSQKGAPERERPNRSIVKTVRM